MTNTLRNRVKQGCKQISQQAVDILYTQREELQKSGIIKWCHVITIDIPQTHGESWVVPVAMVGKFAKPDYIEMFIYD